MFSNQRFSLFSVFNIFLVTLLFAASPIAVSAQDSNFTCAGICGEGVTVANPDTTVTYDWNPRVPVGSSTVGETVQTLTCSDVDSRLYSFSDDPTECSQHQTRSQEVGCTCSGSSAVVMTSGFVVVVMAGMMMWI
jgi:hypothetical protein